VAALVISDASPLIALARVDGLAWLHQLFGSVWIPQEVAGELLTGNFPEDEARIGRAIDAGWIQVVPEVPEGPPLPDLDEGEAACIRLALRQAEACLLLIDERAGRAIAQELGLPVAGTAAVIGMVRRRELIASARAVFARLHASDFRIAPEVITTVLRRCGEEIDSPTRRSESDL
jgi:predicted nucleic acid-binding protein